MIHKLYVTKNGVPLTGLSPVFTVFKTVEGVDVVPPAITELGLGFYFFTYVLDGADIVGTIDVDPENTCGLYLPVIPVEINMPIAAQVWSYATRTMTSLGTLVADIWAYATRTLTSFGTLVDDIDTKLSNEHGVGNWMQPAASTGAFSVVVTLKDSLSGEVVPNACVRVGVGGIEYLLTTGVDGTATFALDANTYTLSATAAGYHGSSTTLVVTESAEVELALEPWPRVGPSTDPLFLTAYGYTRDVQGAIEPDVDVEFQLVTPTVSGIYKRNTVTATSNNVGLLTITLMRNTTYRMRRPTGKNIWKSFTTSDEPTYLLPID